MSKYGNDFESTEFSQIGIVLAELVGSGLGVGGGGDCDGGMCGLAHASCHCNQG